MEKGIERRRKGKNKKDEEGGKRKDRKIWKDMRKDWKDGREEGNVLAFEHRGGRIERKD